MKLEIITTADLAADLGVAGPGGELSLRAVASFLRAPLARWGLSPRREVLRYAREQLKACGREDAGEVSAVLARLVALGECELVYVGHEAYIAPAQPRWIAVGHGVGALLGVQSPEGIAPLQAADPGDIVQRVEVGSDDDAALLEIEGIREVTFEDWLSPVAYLHHAARRARRPVRTDEIDLARFWDVLVEALTDEGLPLGEEAEVRAVEPRPGDFFGRHDAAEVEGRWTSEPGDGVWCAYRRGYGDAHWHPALLAVDGSERRVLDLYDHDEWRWALMARGKRAGVDELLVGESETTRLTFPPPAQLAAALDLVGVRAGPWRWRVYAGAPEPWALIR